MPDNPFLAAVKEGKNPLAALDMLTRQEMDTAGKMFLKAPKTIIEAIISSYIKDEDTAAAIAAYYTQCVEFGMSDMNNEAMVWLMTVLAGWRGINAAGLVFALQTGIGAISEITTTSALRLKGADDLAKHVRERREKDKVEKGKVQD